VKKAPKPKAKTSHDPRLSLHLRRVRKEHALENAEDYVEAISDLILNTGEARAIDLSKQLGLSHVTVGSTLRRLKREGLVSFEPYRSIFLTDKGSKLAEESRHRHQLVLAFLRHLGVPDAIAQADAEGLEHHVSKETLAAFKRVLKK